MRLAVLFSGGKDSVLAMDRAGAYHDVAGLVTLRSLNPESYMFHTPAIDCTAVQARAMDLPHIVRETPGVREEELDDLRAALACARDLWGAGGVVSGAIESVYQAARVEKVCHELGLRSFNPLWQEDQETVLRELLTKGYRAMITGVFAYPLEEDFLGRTIDEATVAQLLELRDRMGFNPAGEGGELETFVTDGPLFGRPVLVSDVTSTYANYAGTVTMSAKVGEQKAAVVGRTVRGGTVGGGKDEGDVESSGVGEDSSPALKGGAGGNDQCPEVEEEGRGGKSDARSRREGGLDTAGDGGGGGDILILSLSCDHPSLQEPEYVRPIRAIVEAAGHGCAVRHYTQVDDGALARARGVILCGTAVGDNAVIDRAGDLAWLRDTTLPVLGICVGGNLLCLLHGGTLEKLTEIGHVPVTAYPGPADCGVGEHGAGEHGEVDPVIGDLDGHQVYDTRLRGPVLPSVMRPLARSEAGVQAFVHRQRPVYGILFHPEVRHRDIIVRFCAMATGEDVEDAEDVKSRQDVKAQQE